MTKGRQPISPVSRDLGGGEGGPMEKERVGEMG